MYTTPILYQECLSIAKAFIVKASLVGPVIFTGQTEHLDISLAC